MGGPGAQDHGDGVQAGDGPAEGGDAEGDVEDEHDDGAGDGAVEHAERAEEEGQDEGEDYALALRGHSGLDARGWMRVAGCACGTCGWMGVAGCACGGGVGRRSSAGGGGEEGEVDEGVDGIGAEEADGDALADVEAGVALSDTAVGISVIRPSNGGWKTRT